MELRFEQDSYRDDGICALGFSQNLGWEMGIRPPPPPSGPSENKIFHHEQQNE
jgi:hypothetical protein